MSDIGTREPLRPFGLPPRQSRRRRPSGSAPPLPHHLQFTGVWLLIAVVATIAVTIVGFGGGLHGAAVAATVVDDAIVGWVSRVHAPGLHTAALVLAGVSSWWVILSLVWVLVISLIVYRRWRHLLVAVIVMQAAVTVTHVLSDATARPRPFGVELQVGWGGWALPSEQMLAITGILVLGLYTMVPHGRWRNHGKWVLAALLSLVALARMHLGVDAPTDIVVAVTIAVAFPVVAFRFFVPNDAFPVTYQLGEPAHLDVGGARTAAIRQAVMEQLGVVVDEIRPVGWSGSAGSTPLLLRVKGAPTPYLFGKLYSKVHLRSDRWYKIGRELLFGRLEDEKPFNTVRQLVEHEDYALRRVRDAGIPGAAPYGFVELTPDREYVLVTEFLDGAVEVGEADVDEGVIDSGLQAIRKMWDAGLAHRDIKPANLMVRDGTVLLIDPAFIEVRPTPWREAVDLANMMLCLALRSSPEQVYERAQRQFSVEEISEGFAAAHGLALPTQLRKAVRTTGRDLREEFIQLLPERPRPIDVQLWSPRRVGLWVALVAVVVLIGAGFVKIVNNRTTTRTPYRASGLDCTTLNHLEPLWLEAQSVQTAPFVPCVASLPLGWSIGSVYANSGRSEFSLNHDRAGRDALHVTLTRSCDVRDTAEVAPRLPGSRRFVRSAGRAPRIESTYDVLPGGCITTDLNSRSTAREVVSEVTGDASRIAGYIARATLDDTLADRSDGRLHLDPAS